MSAKNIKGLKKRHGSTLMPSSSLSKLSIGRRSAIDLPNIITINDEQYEFLSKQDPIGRQEKELMVKKHQQRLDEIEGMHIRIGSNFSLNPRKLGEPFSY